MQADNARPEISVVVPVYNESGNLPELWNRLVSTMEAIPVKNFEVIFVDDGCTDNSAKIIEGFHKEDPRAKLVSLSRNFGHAPALSAGLAAATGQAIVLMDADLQDRPEAIAEFYKAWKDGAEVCYAVRTSREENIVLRAMFKSFYMLMSFVSGVKMPLDAGVFCLIDQRVSEVMKELPEHHRYFPGLRAFVGFSQRGVPVDRDARFAGESRVGLGGQIRLAMNGLFSFSYLPLRIAMWLGLIVAASSFVVLLNVLYKKWVSGEAILGWASTMTAVLFIGGVQLITLGIVGEYVGRIYEETKRRPLYVISHTLGMGKK